MTSLQDFYRSLWRTLTRNVALIIACALGLALLAALASLIMTPRYEATSLLLVNGSQAAIVEFDSLPSSDKLLSRGESTQVHLASSREVAIRVIRQLSLTTHPEYTDLIEGAVLSQSGRPDYQGETGLSLEEAVLLPVFFKQLTVELVRDSDLVRIHYSASDRQLAATVANQVSTEYIDTELNLRTASIQRASERLTDKIAQLRNQLETSSAAQLAYEGSQALSDEQGVNGTTIQKLRSLGDQLSSAVAERLRLEELIKQLSDAKGGAQVNAILESNPLIVSARNRLQQAQGELNNAASQFGSAHPTYRAARSKVVTARRSLNRGVAAATQNLQSELALARQLEASLTASLRQTRDDLQAKREKLVGLSQIAQQTEVNRNLYQALLTRLGEVNALLTVQNPVAQLVDRAIAPQRQAWPQPVLMISAGLLCGLLLGVLLALLRAWQDTTIRTTEQATRELQVPVLGTISQSLPEWGDKRGKISALHPTSLYATTIRHAAGQVQIALASGQLRSDGNTLCVTSSDPLDDSSMVATNLSIELARQHRVLLIDADLDNRLAGSLIGAPANADGLVQFLQGEAELRDIVRKGKRTNLSVITAGHGHPAVVATSSFSKFNVLLGCLRTKYDLVIVNTPSVTANAQSPVIAAACTHSLLVIGSGVTPVARAQQALTALELASPNVLGTILNNHDFARAQKDYGEPSALVKYQMAQLKASRASSKATTS